MASPTIHCAVYTRKSTEEGLDQAFNSLDAQREACAAYIASQRHEGWTMVPDFYDDGGISGGTMERPGLKQLLADVTSGKVQVIVVYKVDRLTRSLADFARIVDILDKAGASFVSVTQAFNTTSSMGRLTLNVLLSFAQFEREVTGERIRDKIAASKKKGMWMGGNPPLGYDVRDRKLVVNDAEAAQVRHIFERYLELGSVRALKLALDAAGVRSKVHIAASGRALGGKPFSKGALYALLQNRIYLGEVRHRDDHYPGQHDAILDLDLFEKVQALLEHNRVARRSGENVASPSLLIGLVVDARGRRMSPTHACKAGKRYRYYCSSPHLDETVPQWRVPAVDLEELVIAMARTVLTDRHRLTSLFIENQSEVSEGMRNAAAIIDRLMNPTLSCRRAELPSIIDQVVVAEDSVCVSLKANTLGLDGPPIVETRSVAIVRSGNALKMVIDGPEASRPTNPDLALIKLIAKAHLALAAALDPEAQDLNRVAEQQGVTRNYLGRLLRLAYLAPDVTSTILSGHQPLHLNRQRLARLGDMPMAWADQRRWVGAQ